MAAIIQLSTTGGLVSKGVQFRTFSWASHVDFVTSEGTLIGADWKEGVIEKEFDQNNYKRVERYEVKGSDQELVEAYMVSQLGKKYDFGAIFGFLSRTDKFENQDKWFCSELVAWAFKESGTPMLNPDVDLHVISPGNLLMSPLLERTSFLELK